MEANQFDHVAKAIGQGTARRRLLAGLLGAALAGSLEHATGSAKGKRRRRLHAQRRGNQQGNKNPIGCSSGTDVCVAEPFNCNNGTCFCATHQTGGNVCVKLDVRNACVACARDADCAPGFACVTSNSPVTDCCSNLYGIPTSCMIRCTTAV
jgi:hypothetical protein